MRFITMTAIVANRGTGPNHRHVWLNDYINPGPISSIGDVNLQVRLKHSFPDAPLRYTREFSHKRIQRLGSNVTDGQYVNYDTGAGPPKLIDKSFTGTRDFKILHGYRFQDIRDLDRSTVPIDGSLPQYSWNNKIAQTYKSMHTGEKFLPLPGKYQLPDNEIPRGGNYPRVTDRAGMPSIEQENFTRMNNVSTSKDGDMYDGRELKSTIANPRNPFMRGKQYSDRNAPRSRMKRVGR